MIRPLFALFVCGCLSAQTPPQVVSLAPSNLADAVEPGRRELVVTFDQDMDPSGQSVCSGSKSFPKFAGRPRWQGARKLVFTAELQPDTEYELIFNCSSSRTLKAKAGAKLPRVTWQFTTLPADPLPIAKQRERNAAAISRLEQLLDANYSYRDRKVKDWAALREQHRAVLLGARTDRAFAIAAAKMLASTEDRQVSLRYREAEIPAYNPWVEPLYRTFAVRRLMKLEAISPRAYRSQTEDGIAYLLITGWQDNVDPERLIGAIAEMMAAKALVLDVRAGTGGEEEIARRVASWFVEGSQVYAGHKSRSGPGPDNFSDVEDRLVVGQDQVYDRPVAVLAGPRVMRANESFVLMMKKAKDAIIVGQRTAGSSGNPKPYDLGNGVTVLLPSWQVLRPDGTCWEGEGIAPDVFVPCTSRDFRDRDPPLDKALELLRKRIAKDQ